jgi:hypothetical protein
VQLFGETGADGRLIFLEHLPDGLEIVFLRYAGFLELQANPFNAGFLLAFTRILEPLS